MGSTLASADDLIVVSRRSEQLDLVDDKRRRRLVAAGTWTRVIPGVYVLTAEWSRLRPIDQHRVRIGEVARRLDAGALISHMAAAAEWGIDVLGKWPTTIDITIDRASGGRSGGSVRRHALGREGIDRVPFGVHEITSPAQTALDLARSLPLVRASSAVDQALWTGRRGGALTTREVIIALMDADAPRRGDVQARRVIESAETLAANVRETQARVVITQLGFPFSRPQEHRELPSGRDVFGDRYFPDHDHWLEIDGRGKYLSPEFGSERDPAAIVIDEKNRENEIRREVRGFSRLEATDFDHPRRVYDILTGDGLPSRKRRP